MGRWPTRSPRTHSTRARLAVPPRARRARLRLGTTNNGAFHAGEVRDALRPPRSAPPPRAAPRAAGPRALPARRRPVYASADAGRSGTQRATARAPVDGWCRTLRLEVEPLDLARARSYVGRVRRETVTSCGSTFLLAVFGSTSTTILGSEREATETFSRRHSAPRQKRKGTVQLQGPPRLASRARQILLFFHRSSLFAADRRLRPWFRCLPARHVRGDTPSASLTTQHAEARFGCLVG